MREAAAALPEVDSLAAEDTTDDTLDVDTVADIEQGDITSAEAGA